MGFRWQIICSVLIAIILLGTPITYARNKKGKPRLETESKENNLKDTTQDNIIFKNEYVIITKDGRFYCNYTDLNIPFGQFGSDSENSKIKIINIDSINVNTLIEEGSIISNQDDLDSVKENRWGEVVPDQDNDSETNFAKKSDLAGAKKEYLAAIEDNPKDANAHNALGVLLRFEGALESAEVEYQKAIALDPNNPIFHGNLGLLLVKKGDYIGAEEEYREALRLDPSNFLAGNNLGVVLWRQGDFEGAEKELSLALKVAGMHSPYDYMTVARNLLIVLIENAYEKSRLGDLEVATQKIDKVISILEAQEVLDEAETKRFNSHIHFVRGGIFLKKRCLRKAVKEFREALAFNPKDARTRYNLAYGFFLLRKWDEAEMAALAALSLQRGDYPRAEELLRDIEAVREAKSFRIRWWGFFLFGLCFFIWLGFAILISQRSPKLFSRIIGVLVVVSLIFFTGVMIYPMMKAIKGFPIPGVGTIQLDLDKIEFPPTIDLKLSLIEDRPFLKVE